MVLYAIVYLPLHYDAPINFGEPLYFGDLLAICSGGVAITLGVLGLRRASSRPGSAGAILILAGLPTLILVVFWAFPETFNLDYYFSKPIYFGFVYFARWARRTSATPTRMATFRFRCWSAPQRCSLEVA